MSDLDSRALKIVEDCLDLDEGERLAFVDREAGGCDALAARVRHILAMEAGGLGFLSTHILARQHGEVDDIPERIGRFRVTGLIGRGGMGMVVRAHRDDGVYNQEVAIKLIRAGLRGEVERDRFAKERRLLARLSHSAIARIMDGGEENDRPWLAMELVDGSPVTADLARRGAGLEERLEVFDRIAEAVGHAHRNLVIHGDIKPSNILRAADGSVKLLDFGIGRLTEDLQSSNESYPLTPAYAAPERHAGEPPTVSADVFSLGVLLHQMLADALPRFGRPMSESANGPDVAPARLQGDLDLIVARSMAEDPMQRYPDVSAFLQDIARYRLFQPIAARPATVLYTSKLFLRRNRLAVAIATLLVLVLSTATLVSTLLYFDGQRQRATAVTRFEQLRSLARFQLFDLYDGLAETPGTTAARARLAVEAQHYLDSLAAIPDPPADLALDVARGLDRLAAVQGVPRIANLGRPAEARRNLTRAAMILDRTPKGSLDVEFAAERARNRILRAQVATWTDFRSDVAKRLLAGAGVPEGYGGEQGREIEASRRSARLDVLSWEEKYPELRQSAEADLAWLDRWPQPRGMSWHTARADALNARGDARYYLRDREGALGDYQTADLLLTAAETRWPRRSAILARQMISGYNIASARMEMGRHEGLVAQSDLLLRRGDSMLELEANDEALRRRQVMNRELAAQILDGLGRHEEAAAQQILVVAERERTAKRQPGEARAQRDLAFSRAVLGTLRWNVGRRVEACGAWRAAGAGFEPLAREGRLSAFDREHSLFYVRSSLAVCDGRRPVSAYRGPA